MNYLLDTHATLWLVSGDERLGPDLIRRLDHPRANVLLSAVVLWEIAIKSGLGKLTIPSQFRDVIDDFAFEPLPITDEHAWAVRELPPVHRDPFDRPLVAQATREEATIVSADTIFDKYNVNRAW